MDLVEYMGIRYIVFDIIKYCYISSNIVGCCQILSNIIRYFLILWLILSLIVKYGQNVLYTIVVKYCLTLSNIFLCICRYCWILIDDANIKGEDYLEGLSRQIFSWLIDSPKSFKIAITCYFSLPATVMTGYDLLWPEMISYDHLWPVTTSYVLFWLIITTYNELWLVMTSYDEFLQVRTS